MASCFICNILLVSEQPRRRWGIEYCDECGGKAKNEYSNKYLRTIVHNHKKRKIYCSHCISSGISLPPECCVCGGSNNCSQRLRVEIPDHHRSIFIVCNTICMDILINHIKRERKGYCPSCETRYPSHIKIYVNRWVDQSRTHPWLVWLGIYSKHTVDSHIEEYNKGMSTIIGVD